MADDRNLFERLDSIETTSESTNKMVSQILGILQSQKPTVSSQPKHSQKELFQEFLKQSKKSYKWFGTSSEFRKWKTLAIISFAILLLIGLISTITTAINFGIYSTFSLFENIWMIFGIIYLVFAMKSKPIYEVNSLASNSTIKYKTDNTGMKFPRRERIVFTIFRVLAIIAILCNLISIWVGVGNKTIPVTSTIMEFIYLGAIIFSFIMNLRLFSQYSIIWVEGNNLVTKEKVVLVLPPGANKFMAEEEFKKTLPFIYE